MFTLQKQFNITVPKDYNPKTQLTTFKKKYGKDFYLYNGDITDENFKNSKLKAGKEYTVKVFGIDTLVTTSDKCIAKIKKENGILTGAQGASLVYQLKKDEFSNNKLYISFDEKDRLWKDTDDLHRVPCVYRLSDGDFSFNLGFFEGDWGADGCVLCFCECEPSKPLTLDEAIKVVKKGGYKIYKEI